jgi:hypothetical protein
MHDDVITENLKRACDHLEDDNYGEAFDWLAQTLADMAKYGRRPSFDGLTQTEVFHLLEVACHGADMSRSL